MEEPRGTATPHVLLDVDRLDTGRGLWAQVPAWPLPRLGPALMTLSLAAADGSGLILAYALAAWLGRFLGLATPGPDLWPAVALFLPAFGLAGLYPGTGISSVQELRQLTLATTLGFAALAAAMLLFGGEPVLPWTILALAWAAAVALLPGLRSGARHLLGRAPWWGVPVIVLGTARTTRTTLDVLGRHPELGLKPVAAFCDEPVDDAASVDGAPSGQGGAEPSQDRGTASGRPAAHRNGTPVLGSLRLAGPVAAHLGVRHALISLPDAPRESVAALVRRCSETFSHITLIPDLAGVATSWATTRTLGDALGVELRQNLLRPLPAGAKQLVDLLGGLVAGLLSLSLVLLLALLIKLDSPGPVFFRQERVGKGGRTFRALKFRTMVVDAEARLQDVLRQDPEARREYERYHKLRNDPRVTRMGRMLRKLSLDELPQIWNVLKGEMSLVGPRAYLPRERPEMGEAAGVILRVNPGITGLWQVSGRNEVSFQERLVIEESYVRNWSIWLDVYILARTVAVVLGAKGAY